MFQESFMRLAILICGLLFFTPIAFAEEGEEAADIIYMPLTPQFTVNLLGNKHYLRTSIQLQLTDESTKEAIEANDPAIRHALIVLLSNNNVEDISSGTGKIDLQNRAIETLNKTLTKYANNSGVEAVFFTEFVSQ
jgi:flagellar protein FliL